MHKPRQQKIIRERRQYNQWVASQTLEDYALRFTAQRARSSTVRASATPRSAPSRSSPARPSAARSPCSTVSRMPPGPSARSRVLMFLIGLPIAYYAAKYGVDIDLLTRGAGFGYMGSTITSLIYASFTFLLFAIEASIMSVALQPGVRHPAVAGAHHQLAGGDSDRALRHQPHQQDADRHAAHLAGAAVRAHRHTSRGSIRPRSPRGRSSPARRATATARSTSLLFGLAASVLLSLLPQIGEQVDYLRFLPDRTRANRVGLVDRGDRHRARAGCCSAASNYWWARSSRSGAAPGRARRRRPTSPPIMYHLAFREVFQSPTFALVLTGIFVIVCQLKINVTNAYAGSIAWSNFFSRLTHSHPGPRGVAGVQRAAGAAADGDRHLPRHREHPGHLRQLRGRLDRRADRGPGHQQAAGLSARSTSSSSARTSTTSIPSASARWLLSVLLSSLAFMGVFGEYAQILSPFVALLVAFVAAPLIAVGHRRHAITWRAQPTGCRRRPPRLDCSDLRERVRARRHGDVPGLLRPDLLAVLHARGALPRSCARRTAASTSNSTASSASVLPERVGALLNTRAGHFGGLLLLFNLAIGLLLALIYQQYSGSAPGGARGHRAPRCGWCSSRCCSSVGRRGLADRARA